MKRFAILLAICAVLSGCGTAKSLVILHVNDTHSHLDPTHEGRGGVIERAAFVDSVRASAGEKNVLLLHAGDFDQGTSYFTVLGGDLEVQLINDLGYDCITLGNHEFDNGIEDLARRLAKVNCPVVCANFDFSPFELRDYVKPYTVVRKAGRKIGIIGLLCDIKTCVSKVTADRIPYLGDEAELATSLAAKLRTELGCDYVIVLSHMGFREDLSFAAQTKGIDVVIGGHSHTFIDEPSMVTDLDGKSVPVVQAGSWGKDFGVIEVTF